MSYRPDRLPRVLNREERAAFLATFNTRYKTPHRDRTACRLMVDLGLRVGEVVALRPEHLDLSGCVVHVREGKGAKDRDVSFERSASLLRDLQDWLERRADAYPESPWLFPTGTGSRLDPRHLWRTVKRAAKRAELDEHDRISPHDLRHTFAAMLYKRTKDLRAVQKALGHADVSTTQIYTHLNGEDVREAVGALHADLEDGPDDDADDSPDVDALAAAISNLDAEDRKALARAFGA